MLKKNKLNVPKKSCINCHFFCGISNSRDEAINYYHEINDKRRNQFKSDLSLKTPFSKYGFGCMQKVWRNSKLIDFTQSDIINLLLEDRTDFCYFFEYRPSMSPEGGVELERRERENEMFHKEMNATRIGLVITAIASIAALITALIALFTSLAK